ncbi:MAG: hypothetical protein MUE99_05965 [Chitinophagaceae bacterium]|nr:hypothetical protein [Chitinophagaceae bacterium]
MFLQQVSFLVSIGWLTVGFSGIVFAQTQEVDAVIKNINKAVDERGRLLAMEGVFANWYNIQRDTLYKYASEAWHLTKSSSDINLKAKAALALSRSYMQWGWVDSALGYIEPFLAMDTAALPHRTFLELNWHAALAHGGVSRYKDGLELLYRNCRLAEVWNDDAGYAFSANSIGSLLISMQRPKEAKQWIEMAMQMCRTVTDYPYILPAVYTNYGSFWLTQKNYPVSRKYLDSALQKVNERENLSVRAILMRNIAMYHLNQRQMDEAEAAFRKMVEARSKLAEGYSFVEENIEMARFYDENGFPEKAIALCEKNLRSGNLYDTSAGGRVVNNEIKTRLVYYNMLMGLYKKTNQYDKYVQTLEQLVVAKDSFYTYNNAEIIADLQAKYELSEKEKILAQQKIRLWRQNLGLFSVSAFVVLAGTLGAVGFSRYRKRQRRRLEETLAAEKQKAEKEKSEAAEHERRRIAADLHDNLGAYGAALKSNLQQIKKQGMLPVQAAGLMEENVQHMVDELGNTIWVLNAAEQNVTALYDKLKTWTRRLLNSYPEIKCRFEERVDQEILFTPKEALHWLYIMQEAINNAVKHSRGNLILIRLESSDHWKVFVEDNGIGIHQETEPGQGLKSIRERSQKAGWEVDWQMPQTGGTTFTLAGPAFQVASSLHD